MYNKLSCSDFRILGLAALGGALEFYDFIIFVYLSGVLSQIFFPGGEEWVRQFQTFGVFASGFLARPLGGVLMAHFGDLFGRKKVFMVSVLMISFATLAIGLLPTYEMIGFFAPVLLLVCRIFQGCAVGGEVPGAWVFVAEHVSPKHVGFACSCVSAGLTLGILIGSMVAAIINVLFSKNEIISYVWRAPFILGGLFGFLSLFLRRWLHETPVFRQMQKKRTLAEESPIKVVLRDYRDGVKVTVSLTLVLSVFVVLIILLTPTLLEAYFDHSANEIFLAANLANVSLVFGSLLAGYLVDQIGARKTIASGIGATGLTYFLLLSTAHLDAIFMYIFYAFTGLFVGVVAAIPFVFILAFPPKIRFSGISFSYNFSYALFAGLIPLLIPPLCAFHRLAPAFFVIIICVAGLVCCFTLIKKDPSKISYENEA